MEVYKRLREKIDKSIPIPTPQTKSEVEIEILKRIFTPEEAELACNLSPQPENVKTIAERMGRSPDEISPMLEEMVKKGGIFKVYTDEPMYCLVPMMPGIYEFQLGKLTPDMVELFEKYYAEGQGQAIFSNKTPFSRVVPIKKAIPTEISVLTYEEVERLIDEADTVTLATCLCRSNKKMIGEGCDAPIDDICILLNSWGVYYAKNGLGKEVSKEEGKKALDRAAEAGLVHCTLNVKEGKDTLFICNCCGCCCALLRGITQLKIPTAVAKSNFMAVVDEDECTGCEECMEHCHVKAIELKDSIAEIDYNRCIGCGVCVTFCPVDALSMKRRETHITPPDTINDLMVNIMKGR